MVVIKCSSVTDVCTGHALYPGSVVIIYVKKNSSFYLVYVISLFRHYRIPA